MICTGLLARVAAIPFFRSSSTRTAESLSDTIRPTFYAPLLSGVYTFPFYASSLKVWLFLAMGAAVIAFLVSLLTLPG